MIPKDPKRTNVKAVKIPEYPEDHWIEPGSCYFMLNAPDLLCFACPGCGGFGSITCGIDKPEPRPSWKIESGTLLDPTTLTLSPSINCVGCCGWHGYLKNGIFISC
jgi:Family of unknown function (DUF6527)